MKNVGVIGCGRIASEYDDDPKRRYVASHIGAYTALAQTVVVAVCDVDQDRLKKSARRWKIPNAYQDYRAMLKREDLDIVSICTPPETHYAIVKEAVKHKKIRAIFCEKPITKDIKQAQRMVQLCASHKVLLQVNHQRRFDALHREVRQWISSGRYGQVQQANFYYSGGIYNSGSHMFDLLRYFFGEVKWVQGIYSGSKSIQDQDPHIDGTIFFKNGLLVPVQAFDRKKYFLFEMSILFDKGRLVLKNSGMAIDFYKVAPSEFFSGLDELRLVKSPLAQKNHPDFMIEGVKHLLACLKNGQRSISSGEDGLVALRLVTAFVRSAKQEGRRIFL